MEDAIVEIPLTKGYVCVVDAVDADLIEHRWHVTVAHERNMYAIRRVELDGKWINVHMHRLILERKLSTSITKGYFADHIDGDGLNNRRSNLRLATPAENTRHRRMQRNNISGYRGVHFTTKSGKWRAQIGFNGGIKVLGDFNTPEEANRAYLVAAEELFGDFRGIDK